MLNSGGNLPGGPTTTANDAVSLALDESVHSSVNDTTTSDVSVTVLFQTI